MYAQLRRLAMLAVAFSLGACASDTGGQGATITPGFYRYADEGAVFYIPPAANSYCLVVSVSMMEAFGGFSQVHVVDHSVDFKGARTWTEQCPWPAGKYRNVGSAVVYDVSPTHKVCREAPAAAKVADTSVHVIASDSNVQLKSKFTGICGAK